MNAVTKFALILLRLQAGEHFTQQVPQGFIEDEHQASSRVAMQRQQLLWFLAILLIMQAGLTKQRGDAGWHPEKVCLEQYAQLLEGNTEPIETVRLRLQWELSTLLLVDPTKRQEILTALRSFLSSILSKPTFLLRTLPYSNGDNDASFQAL